MAEAGKLPAISDWAWFSAEREIKQALAQDIKDFPLSRAQIADALTRGAGWKITASQVDHWVAATNPHRFPASLLGLWVRITGSRRALEAQARVCGLIVADQVDCEFAALGRALVQREKLDGQFEALKSRLAGKA